MISVVAWCLKVPNPILIQMQIRRLNAILVRDTQRLHRPSNSAALPRPPRLPAWFAGTKLDFVFSYLMKSLHSNLKCLRIAFPRIQLIPYQFFPMKFLVVQYFCYETNDFFRKLKAAKPL